jgi:hypothetical protein
MGDVGMVGVIQNMDNLSGLIILYIDIGPSFIITYFLFLEIYSKMIVLGEPRMGRDLGGEIILKAVGWWFLNECRFFLSTAFTG